MADSIREQIIADIKATLEGITVNDGYDFNMQRVYRLSISPFQVGSLPVAIVMEVSEEKNDGSIGAYHTDCFLNVGILIWDKESDRNSASERTNILLSNVEKALKQDIKRSNLAIDTNLLSNELSLSAELFPYVGIILNIQIHYRHLIANPFSQ
jgi:hypothetical protein